MDVGTEATAPRFDTLRTFTWRVKGATAIDAIVMASAALRGDLVLTSDVHDLERLRSHFPTVRVLGV